MRLPFARYGLREVLLFGSILFVLCVLSGFFFIYLLPLFVILLGFVLYFFRDPSRKVPTGPNLLVAPADGRVTEIVEVDDETLGCRVQRISIFLSIFSVHINRAPCAGKVVSLDYQSGKFLNALNPDSAHLNEMNTVVMECEEASGLKVVVRQIAGIIARRIVCGCEVGDSLERGEQFGMIKFGSRTDLMVPLEHMAKTTVKVGDKVRAGKTVMGEVK